MGNKAAGLSGGPNVGAAPAGGAAAAAAAAQPAAQAAQPDALLKGVPAFPAPIVRESVRLGKLLRQRDASQDAVAGVGPGAARAAGAAAREGNALKTAMVVARQKRIHLEVKRASAASSSARAQAQAALEQVSTQSLALGQALPLSLELGRACDQLAACLALCRQVNELLPPEQRLEPVQLR